MFDKLLFQIIDQKGNVVDKNLSYEEAVMWIDQTTGSSYAMQPMKEDDQK